MPRRSFAAEASDDKEKSESGSLNEDDPASYPESAFPPVEEREHTNHTDGTKSKLSYNQAELDEDVYNKEEAPDGTDESRFLTDSICFSACRLAQRTKASAIVAMSFSGYTGYKVSSWRPHANVFVFTGNKRILTQMNLVWGVKAFYYDKMVSTDQTIADIRYELRKRGFIRDGEYVINIASMPINEQGMTNMVKITKV